MLNSFYVPNFVCICEYFIEVCKRVQQCDRQTINTPDAEYRGIKPSDRIRYARSGRCVGAIRASVSVPLEHCCRHFSSSGIDKFRALLSASFEQACRHLSSEWVGATRASEWVPLERVSGCHSSKWVGATRASGWVPPERVSGCH